MTRTKAFINGFASTTVQKILTKAIGLLVTPIVLSYLDNSEYGVWIIIGSMLGYMGLMDFGVTGATVAITAKSNTSEREHRINTIINNSIFMQLIIGVLIIIFGFIAANYFPKLIQLDGYNDSDAYLVFLVAVVSYGISMPPKALKGLIKARQMIALTVWVEFVLFALTTSLSIYLLHRGFGLLAMPASALVIKVVSYPVYIYFAKKAYARLYFDIDLIRITEIKNIFGVSSIWFLGMISAMIIYSTDTILIGMYISTATVTTYALSYRLTEVIREFIYSINFNLMPAIGQIMGQGDAYKAKEIYLRTQPIILSLAASGAIFIYQFNSIFVKHWVGETNYAGDTLSLIFSGILFTSVVFHSSSLVISADLKIKEVTIIRFLESTINIILSLMLIGEYGLFGVAISTLIAAVITSFTFVPIITARHLKIGINEYFSDVVSKVIIVSLICLLTILFFDVVNYKSTLWEVVSLIIYGLISSIIMWKITLDSDMKNTLMRKLRFAR